MISKPTRRFVLKSAAATSPALLSASAAIAGSTATTVVAPTLVPNSIPVSDLPSHFDVEPGVHNLENGYWGIMPRVVADTYVRQCVEVNRPNSVWARNVMPGGACLNAGGRESRAAIARLVGCLPEEIAITRSGSEGLQML